MKYHAPLICRNRSPFKWRHQSSLTEEQSVTHGALILQLSLKATNVLETLDPNDELTFLRIESKKGRQIADVILYSLSDCQCELSKRFNHSFDEYCCKRNDLKKQLRVA